MFGYMEQDKQKVYFSHLLMYLEIGSLELVHLLFHEVIILGCFYVFALPSLVCGFHLYDSTTMCNIHILYKKKGRVEPKRGISGEFSWGKQISQPKSLPLLLHWPEL